MAAQFTQTHLDPMRFEFWLVFAADGGMRFSRGQPQVSRGERAMACSAMLPKSLFRTPELKATISFPDGAPQDFKIDIEAAGEALRHVVGVDIDLQIRETPRESE